jgi:hypothetical protein
MTTNEYHSTLHHCAAGSQSHSDTIRRTGSREVRTLRNTTQYTSHDENSTTQPHLNTPHAVRFCESSINPPN